MIEMEAFDQLIPPFDLRQVFVEPWAEFGEVFAWVFVMGFLVTATCGFIGTFIVWRRMALVGDAISHSVLPGIVVAFLWSGGRDALPMFLGALAMGIATTLLIEYVHTRSRVKSDAAIGIVFTTLFALGVVMVSLYGSQVDLDLDCVLFGELEHVAMEPLASFAGVAAPASVWRMGAVALAVLLLALVFYRPLLLSSFDPGLARAVGIKPEWVHHMLMCGLAVVVVSAFEAVGAVLVVAMLIFPGATGSLLSDRLPVILSITGLIALLGAFFGLHLALWLDVSTAGAISVVIFGFFVGAWLFSPHRGLLRRLWGG